MTGIDDIKGAREDALQLAFKFDDDFMALARKLRCYKITTPI